jgi:hypothetical protein
MNSQRAQSYGRVMRTLDEMGGTLLRDAERERIREAADTLLFSESLEDPGVREALDDIEELATVLVESERWSDERARRLLDDIGDCGPLSHVS